MAWIDHSGSPRWAAWAPPRRRTFQWLGLAVFVSLLWVTYAQLVSRRQRGVGGVKTDSWQDLWRPVQTGWAPDTITVPTVHDELDNTYPGDIVQPQAKGRVLVTGGGGMIGESESSCPVCHIATEA
jgi:hypothetical protein